MLKRTKKRFFWYVFFLSSILVSIIAIVIVGIIVIFLSHFDLFGYKEVEAVFPEKEEVKKIDLAPNLKLNGDNLVKVDDINNFVDPRLYRHWRLWWRYYRICCIRFSKKFRI